MGLQSRNKVSATFSMSSMTDIVFLLLIFFMITSTLVHPTALKLLLPKSNNQENAKPNVAVSISPDLRYFIGDKAVSINQLEKELVAELGNNDERYISLHADRTVDIEHVVKVMNIAKRNKYKMILATSPEK
jgi:biopolymer transport protein ExbD